MTNNGTNFIDFLHDHYSNGSNTDMSRTLARLQQHLDRQRKLVLDEIATVQKEEEQFKCLTHANSMSPALSIDQKNACLSSFDIAKINKLPLDL
jgi:hypothetical protein